MNKMKQSALQFFKKVIVVSTDYGQINILLLDVVIWVQFIMYRETGELLYLF